MERRLVEFASHFGVGAIPKQKLAETRGLGVLDGGDEERVALRAFLAGSHIERYDPVSRGPLLARERGSFSEGIWPAMI
jgi:hypothetical protein